MKDQQEAEKRKVASQDIQEQLAVQTNDIREKKEIVLVDLSKVEPAVRDAQNGMSYGKLGLGSVMWWFVDIKGTNSSVRSAQLPYF